jgi:hypothetical protein
MKMIFVIFRRSLHQDIGRLLKGFDIKDLKEAPTIFDMRDAGHEFDSFHWSGFNSMIVAAMGEDLAEQVVRELKAFRDHLAQLQGDANIPMRVFSFPCDQLV